jgi:CheY-like chemotaxis protein
LRGKILLITVLDETHRQLLLESCSYKVTVARSDEAVARLVEETYQLVLATTDDGVDTALKVCATVKKSFPDVKVAIVAHRAEYVPATACADAVIREQYSPGRFLAKVKKLMEASGEQSLPASTSK